MKYLIFTYKLTDITVIHRSLSVCLCVHISETLQVILVKPIIENFIFVSFT